MSFAAKIVGGHNYVALSLLPPKICFHLLDRPGQKDLALWRFIKILIPTDAKHCFSVETVGEGEVGMCSTTRSPGKMSQNPLEVSRNVSYDAAMWWLEGHHPWALTPKAWRKADRMHV